MPKLYAIAPTDTVPVTLESESDLPIEQRVKFQAKVLSVHEIGKIEELFHGISDKDKLDRSQIKSLEEGLDMIVKGWENFTFQDGTIVVYKEYKNKLSELFGINTASELFGAALKANTLEEEDKGN